MIEGFIIEKFNLKKTDINFAASFVNDATIMEYKDGWLIMDCDLEGITNDFDKKNLLMVLKDVRVNNKNSYKRQVITAYVSKTALMHWNTSQFDQFLKAFQYDNSHL